MMDHGMILLSEWQAGAVLHVASRRTEFLELSGYNHERDRREFHTWDSVKDTLKSQGVRSRNPRDED